MLVTRIPSRVAKYKQVKESMPDMSEIRSVSNCEFWERRDKGAFKWAGAGNVARIAASEKRPQRFLLASSAVYKPAATSTPSKPTPNCMTSLRFPLAPDSRTFSSILDINGTSTWHFGASSTICSLEHLTTSIVDPVGFLPAWLTWFMRSWAAFTVSGYPRENSSPANMTRMTGGGVCACIVLHVLRCNNFRVK